MRRRNRQERGTAIVLAIVISLIITGLVCAMAWVAGQNAQSTGALSKLDQAFFAAESGAQRVAWYFKNGEIGNVTSPLTGTINGYSYTTGWTSSGASSINVTSVGSLGSIAYTVSMRIVPPVPPASVIASGGPFDGKNIDITGDLRIGGDFTTGGSGHVSGNLKVHGNASNTGAVSGTVTQSPGSFLTLDLDGLGATLIAGAGLTYNSWQTGTVFNFTLLPGANKVIYVNGDVTNPTFIGAGTLYAKGAVSGVGSFGTLATPVNIVATGDITTNNNQTFYGGLYTKGNWNRGKFDLTGLVYTGGVTQSNNGTSSLTMGAVPFFDPRPSGGVGLPMTISGFAGPQP